MTETRKPSCFIYKTHKSSKTGGYIKRKYKHCYTAKIPNLSKVGRNS